MVTMKLDMHVHTCYSPDSTTPIKTLVKSIVKKGLDGIAITDHNSMGAIKKAENEAKRITPSPIIIPGMEIRTPEGEVIGYYLTEEVKARNFSEVIDEIKAQGALVSIPHPFDSLRPSAVNNPSLILSFRSKIDFLEINGRALPWFNKRTITFAQKHGFKLVGGSDAHYLFELGRVYTEWDGENTKVVGNTTISSLLPILTTAIYKRVKKLWR